MSKFQPETGVVFDQADIQIMKQALDCACAALTFAFMRQGGVDIKTKELLAGYIITDASAGQQDPARLSEAALRRLPPLVAIWEPIESTILPAAPANSNARDVAICEYA